MSYKVSAVTAQHIGDRKDQQDRVLLMASPTMPNTGLAAVADGMGGKTGGGLAAAQVTNTAEQLFKSLGAEESVDEMLKTVISESHTVIRLLSISEEKEPHSTAVVMVFKPESLTWIHLGDSRLYHFYKDRLIHRTKDHSFIEEGLASGRLTPEQAKVHPNRSMLLQALGGEHAPKPTLYRYPMPRAGDSFILCTDGLWAYFSEQELGTILHKMSPRDAAQLLTELARDRAQGRGDNLSFVIIKFEDAL